jgi:hypothetical protein
VTRGLHTEGWCNCHGRHKGRFSNCVLGSLVVLVVSRTSIPHSTDLRSGLNRSEIRPAPYVYFADYRNSNALPRGKMPRRKSKFSEYSTHESLSRVSNAGATACAVVSTTKLLRQSCVDGSELKLSRTTLMFNDNVDFALRYMEGNLKVV